MDRHTWARAVFLADGIGCGLAALAVLPSARYCPAMRPIATVRTPLALALAGTSALLLTSARTADDGALARAAIVNAGWTAGCLAGMAARHTPVTRFLTGATAALDAAMAVTQWSLRP